MQDQEVRARSAWQPPRRQHSRQCLAAAARSLPPSRSAACAGLPIRLGPALPRNCNNAAQCNPPARIPQGGQSAVEEWVELANGCLCCSVKSDFVSALEALMLKRDKFDYVLIETTGGPCSCWPGARSLARCAAAAVAARQRRLSAARTLLAPDRGAQSPQSSRPAPFPALPPHPCRPGQPGPHRSSPLDRPRGGGGCVPRLHRDCGGCRQHRAAAGRAAARRRAQRGAAADRVRRHGAAQQGGLVVRVGLWAAMRCCRPWLRGKGAWGAAAARVVAAGSSEAAIPAVRALGAPAALAAAARAPRHPLTPAQPPHPAPTPARHPTTRHRWTWWRPSRRRPRRHAYGASTPRRPWCARSAAASTFRSCSAGARDWSTGKACAIHPPPPPHLTATRRRCRFAQVTEALEGQAVAQQLAQPGGGAAAV